jgi:hypothetical protein
MAPAASAPRPRTMMGGMEDLSYSYSTRLVVLWGAPGSPEADIAAVRAIPPSNASEA